MAKNIERKDQNMNDLHRRIEELLKVNAAANSLADARAGELEKMRKEFSEVRGENSELRVLNKDQENRLRELQNKTLSNI
jgi:predicted nuclease with TOPRIM domain